MIEAPTPPRFAVRMAIALRTRLMRLADRVVPPQIPLIEHTFGFARTKLLSAIAKAKIADHLAGGPKSAAELARLCGAEPQMLHRAMRALASIGVFDLREDGRFEHNRISEALRTGQPASIAAWAINCGQPSNYAAWADFDATLATGKSAWARVHGKDIWTHYAEHPDEGAVFAQSMADLTDIQAPMIADAYPFAELGTLCDVAGGRGQLLATILQKHPTLKGWLVDEPQVLEGAGAFLASRGVADRVERKPGNMFNEVPRGASAYMMKDILHDWDDPRSLEILKNCRKAMDPGRKLLLVEIIVEKTTTEQPGPIIDVLMAVVCSEGRQRSVAEFASLFEQSGFALSRVVQTSAPACIIEALAV
jgi:O-methyltransferase